MAKRRSKKPSWQPRKGEVVVLVKASEHCWARKEGYVGVVPNWDGIGTACRGVVQFGPAGLATYVVGKLRPATAEEEAAWRLTGKSV